MKELELAHWRYTHIHKYRVQNRHWDELFQKNWIKKLFFKKKISNLFTESIVVTNIEQPMSANIITPVTLCSITPINLYENEFENKEHLSSIKS